jgi:hypothetical protein
MKSILGAALLALAIRTAGAAEPDAYSANYMLPYCKDYLSGGNTLDVGFCAGVVEGIGYMAAILDHFQYAGHSLSRGAISINKSREARTSCRSSNCTYALKNASASSLFGSS